MVYAIIYGGQYMEFVIEDDDNPCGKFVCRNFLDVLPFAATKKLAAFHARCCCNMIRKHTTHYRRSWLEFKRKG